MKLAIHHRIDSFSEKWISYCQRESIPYKIVDCYDSDIIAQLSDCDALLWHHHHDNYKDVLIAKQLLSSVEYAGKKVFPNTKTTWHYDDKLGQKYLLEGLGLPLIPTHVFFSKVEALNWASTTSYPKVFKLRGGAGSEHVRLVKNRTACKRLIKQAFGKGFRKKNRFSFLRERLWHFKRDRSLASFLNISKGFGRLIIPSTCEKYFSRERNYVYFQDYIPENHYDIRVIAIGKRAFAIKRMVRKNDFRASGSGQILYAPEEIPLECVRKSFEMTNAIGAQCLAFDFVFKGKQALLVEISYAFAQHGYLQCLGYWNDELEWIEGSFIPEHFIIEDLIASLHV